MKLRKRSSRERGHSAGEGQPSKRRKRGKKSTEDVWYHNVSPIFEEPISDDFLGLVATPESQERPYEEPSVQVTVERNVPVAPPEEVAPNPDAYTPAMAPEAAPDPYGAMPWADPWTEPGFPAEAPAGSLPAPPWAMEPPGVAPEMTPPPPASSSPPWADATADPSVEPQVQSGPDLAEPERLIPPEPPSEAPVWEPEPSSDPEQPFPPAHPVPQRPFVHEGGPSPVVDPPMIIPIRAYYMTRADDTLRSIAAQFLNTPSRWQELRSLNAAYPGIANAGPDTVLPIGSSIALPGDPLPWGKPDPVYLWTLAEKFLYTAWGREPSPEEVVPFWRGLTSGAKHLDMGASAPPAIDAPAPPTEPPIPPAMQPPAAPPPEAAAAAAPHRHPPYRPHRPRHRHQPWRHHSRPGRRKHPRSSRRRTHTNSRHRRSNGLMNPPPTSRPHPRPSRGSRSSRHPLRPSKRRTNPLLTSRSRRPSRRSRCSRSPLRPSSHATSRSRRNRRPTSRLPRAMTHHTLRSPPAKFLPRRSPAMTHRRLQSPPAKCLPRRSPPRNRATSRR